jgi:hypothetical protein
MPLERRFCPERGLETGELCLYEQLLGQFCPQGQPVLEFAAAKAALKARKQKAPAKGRLLLRLQQRPQRRLLLQEGHGLARRRR